MKKSLLGLALILSSVVFADASEIRVDLKLDSTNYLIGERIRGVVDIANFSPYKLEIGKDKPDRFFIEVYRQHDMYLMDAYSKRMFIADCTLENGEGQKLETFIGDHYALRSESRYIARPVLVHKGTRYEGVFRAFDLIPGVKIKTATQIFSGGAEGLQREFSLVYWMRSGQEHLFLQAKDSGSTNRSWATRDLGPILRINDPTISILPSGEVIILHRLNPDQFVRTEFWSLPKTLNFRNRIAVQDPETAGTNRVRELYRGSGVEAKKNPWYKFW